MSHVIAITYDRDEAATYFNMAELDQLAERCELKYVGRPEDEGFWPAVADCTILCGAWGMPILDQENLARMPQLQALCYAAGTVKEFVTDESYARGVRITTAMHANAIPVAEMTIALITLVNKEWFRCQEAIQADGHMDRAIDISCRGNYDTTIGLIGCGAIAREVLARLEAMNHEVLVYDPYISADLVTQWGATLVPDLATLAKRSDIVSVHAPNIPATRHMCDATFFQQMKDGAHFINTARGALVDEDALVTELQTGRISALLDVTDPEPPEPGHPFYQLPNCWLTPHRAGSHAQELRRLGAYALREVHALLEGRPFTYEVTQDMLATMA